MRQASLCFPLTASNPIPSGLPLLPPLEGCEPHSPSCASHSSQPPCGRNMPLFVQVLVVLLHLRGRKPMDGEGAAGRDGAGGETCGAVRSASAAGSSGWGRSCFPLQLWPTTSPNPSPGAGSGHYPGSQLSCAVAQRDPRSFLALHEKAACGSPLLTAWGSAFLTSCCDLALILNKSHTSGGESTKALGKSFRVL